MWSRLIAVVEEQAQILQRTAFSTIVREYGDLAAGVFDADGRMLVQAVTGTPGHINSMALAVGHVIDHYPIHSMQPGDVYIHNDPWMGTGHTNEISITTPCFRDDVLVGASGWSRAISAMTASRRAIWCCCCRTGPACRKPASMSLTAAATISRQKSGYSPISWCSGSRACPGKKVTPAVRAVLRAIVRRVQLSITFFGLPSAYAKI
jgi:hypothetical protein